MRDFTLERRRTIMDEVVEHKSLEDEMRKFHTLAIQTNANWKTPILSYIKNRQLPSNLDEAKKIKKQTIRFIVLNDILHKKGFSLPYLRCVEQDEAMYILDVVCKDIYEDHSRGARSLIGKIFRA